MRPALFVAAFLAAALAAGARAQRTAGTDPRQRPLEGLPCDRNDLTSYTGVVVRYSRQPGSTTLRIRTDWDTTEDVTLRHPGTDDPSAFFRADGRAFTAADWARIERSKGVIIPGTRAAAWVCTNGKVTVDWLAPKE